MNIFNSSNSALLNLNNFFSWQGWNFFQAVGTIVAFLIAFWATRKSIGIIKRQLEIEQEPGVVVEDKIVSTGNTYKLTIKNIGRGSAFSVTCSLKEDLKHRNDPFFTNSEPHSRNLFPNESVHWCFDTNKLTTPNKNNTNDNKCYFSFFVFYESQLGNIYRTRVKIKFLGDDFVVMENKIEKIQNYG